MKVMGSNLGYLLKIFFTLHFLNLNTVKGEHPRMGALDVCPFIPVQDVSVEECVEISKKFGEKGSTRRMLWITWVRLDSL